MKYLIWIVLYTKDITDYMYTMETANTKSLPPALNPEPELLEVLLQGTPMQIRQDKE